MDIDLLIEVLAKKDTHLYFQMREHFPHELIEAEIQALESRYQQVYHELEELWYQENPPTPPNDPPSPNIQAKPMSDYQMGELVWSWCYNRETNDGEWQKATVISVIENGRFIWLRFPNNHMGQVSIPQQIQHLSY
jgi:hypothetical protein